MVKRAEHLRSLMDIDDMPETAEKIVQAARHILVREGWRALTTPAIAAEAGVYVPAINYYFGSKSGLVAMVFECIMRDMIKAMSHTMDELPADADRVTAIAEVFEVLSDVLVPDGYAAFFETFPHLIRDEKLRQLSLERCEAHEDMILAALTGQSDPVVLEHLRPYAVLFIAVLDGLAVRRLLDPGNRFTPSAITMFAQILKSALDAEIAVAGTPQGAGART